jgi:hypothetical protein
MDASGVVRNIGSIFEMRRAAIYALALQFAATAINYFRSVQPSKPNSPGKFWHNKTAQAAARFFTGADYTSDAVRWFVAHGVPHGIYLELTNDRRHEAIRPLIQRYVGRYLDKVKGLYAD